MWVIVIKSILALVSIFTGGAIFYKYIKDNKVLVFLAGSVSILSAIYLFSEVRRDIDKLVVEKKVEVKVEEKQKKAIEVKMVERKEQVVLEKKDTKVEEMKKVVEVKDVESKSTTSKWIIPTDSICQANGGEVGRYGCKANWDNAKKICKASGGRLPTLDEFKKFVLDCEGKLSKGVLDFNPNKGNLAYKSCYKNNGFLSYRYWTSSSREYFNFTAWTFFINSGSYNSRGKFADDTYISCLIK